MTDSNEGTLKKEHSSHSQEALWDYFQNEHSESFRFAGPRLQHLANLVESGESVLNIGVGSAAFEKFALQREVAVHSLDPSEKAIARVKELLPEPNMARVGRCEKIPFESDLFDVVVMSEVLEHLPEESITLTLGEVIRVLKKGGRFIGTVPARESLDDNIVFCPHCSEKFHRWGHQQSFTVESLDKLLSSHFQKLTIYEKYFFEIQHLNIVGAVAALAKQAAFLLGYRGSNENIVFVGLK